MLGGKTVYDLRYDGVLADPRTTAVTRDLLAGMSLPGAAVTSNIKLVLPPATLRELTQPQIHRWWESAGRG
ncbi:hypothetical protein AB0O01_29355 [Streptomyces sp. NPDC093252]|uniref:hypothetical protein n=1 Tax=Streptomyces sp. NPDC093252 TaxID=3154980 RepID=UPI00344AD63E